MNGNELQHERDDDEVSQASLHSAVEQVEEELELEEAAAEAEAVAELEAEEAASAAPPPPPPPPPPPAAAAAAAADDDDDDVDGGLECRDVVVLLDGSGSLRYYYASGYMAAFCSVPSHGAECRKQSTCIPLKRASGRPLEFLTAWLRSQYESRIGHIHSCRPTLQDGFSQFKKERGIRDPDAPVKI